MNTALKIAAGVVVVAAFGLAEAVCSGRFSTAPRAGLEQLPLELGDWSGTDLDVPDSTLRLSEADEFLSRRYTHRVTGRRVEVTALEGRSGPLAVHTPEVCYGNVGLVMTAPPRRADYAGATLWSAGLERRPLGDLRIHSVWGWAAGGTWLAPDNPRFALAGRPRAGKVLFAWEDGPVGDAPDDLIAAVLAELGPKFGVTPGAAK